MTKLQKGKIYSIRGIEGEAYNDCKFIFGDYLVIAVDSQYFQVEFDNSISELNEIWWDSEGFKITKIK